MPLLLCSVSDKHIACQNCYQHLEVCPLCNGRLNSNILVAQSVIDSINESGKKIENYCFPTDLANEITIGFSQSPIAHGAMGRIFRVKDIYAVKCALIANTAETEEALIHEIAVSRPLIHIPNLVKVYGGVRLPEYGVGIVMEYINGPSLAAALAHSSMIIRNLSIRERFKIALGICQGLNELHVAQLVHRDLKPENVLLARSSDGSYIPKIADFGVSFQLAIASATCVKESCGTVGYDAPEVVMDNKTPSIASDIYALAFTLYELLTAKRIFIGLKSAQILSRFTMFGERPQNWSNDIPDFLQDVIRGAWSKQPDQRTSIGEIIHAIRKSLDQTQLSCVDMLKENNRLRKKVASVQLEDFKSFELFVLDEFAKRMMSDDCEAMQMFIDELPPSLLDKK
jgi:serine/threonine protein kinase